MKTPDKLQGKAANFYKTIMKKYALNEAGIQLLLVGCYTLQRWYQAKSILDNEGLIIQGNIPRIHPAAKVEHDCRLSFSRIMSELNLNGEISEVLE